MLYYCLVQVWVVSDGVVCLELWQYILIVNFNWYQVGECKWGFLGFGLDQSKVYKMLFEGWRNFYDFLEGVDQVVFIVCSMFGVEQFDIVFVFFFDIGDKLLDKLVVDQGFIDFRMVVLFYCQDFLCQVLFFGKFWIDIVMGNVMSCDYVFFLY